MVLTVFTTKTCGQCKQVKKVLSYFGIDYQCVDIDDNPEYQQLIMEKTGRLNVPVTTNGTDYVVGYNPIQLRALK